MEASRELIPVPQVTKEDLDDWLFGTDTKLNERQKALFYKMALASNLNPIKKEIYAVPYGGNFNIITGYEVYLKRAERTGLLEWWEATAEKDKSGELVGKCTIKRRDFSKPVTIEAWFSEYNLGTALWKSKPRTMIRKVAISQAFRMVFSEELGGLPYTSDEIQGEEIKEVQPLNIEDITDKQAAETANEDLKDRRAKALEFLAKKHKSPGEAMDYLDKPIAEWTQEDLDSLKKWAKAGFPAKAPETPQDAPPPEPQGEGQGEPEQSAEGGTAGQGPSVDELLAIVAEKYPLPKLEAMYGKRREFWGADEYKKLLAMVDEVG